MIPKPHLKIVVILSSFQLQITASVRERPLRATLALLLWPTWLAAGVYEPTLLFVTESTKERCEASWELQGKNVFLSQSINQNSFQPFSFLLIRQRALKLGMSSKYLFSQWNPIYFSCKWHYTSLQNYCTVVRVVDKKP